MQTELPNTKDAAGTWTCGQLDRIAATDELRIATPRADGTLRPAIPVWVVRHGDALYIRSYRGDDAVWYRSARSHGQGHITAGGVDTDVIFAHITGEDVNAEIDAAYREKYGRYGPRFIDPMVGTAARATTLKLVPLHNT